jgi:hypothetical protein
VSLGKIAVSELLQPCVGVLAQSYCKACMELACCIGQRHVVVSSLLCWMAAWGSGHVLGGNPLPGAGACSSVTESPLLWL